MFSREILIQSNVPVLNLKKKDTVFREDQKAVNLYYLLSGEVKIYNTDSDGKEFLIDKVSDHHFMGEPPFLLGEKYPANAVIASETAEIFSFTRETFNSFMIGHPDLLLEFTQALAKKTYQKTLRLKSIVHQCPHERIINFLKNHKQSLGLDCDEKTIINVTRKEMAHSTGLAIETVIRTVKKMEREEKIELINHKIYF